MGFEWTPEVSQRIDVSGKSLEVQCWGPSPAEAPTFVMLHEGLGCVALWRDTPARIAEATGWGVVAYSRAGYGQSDVQDLPLETQYMTTEATEVLPQVLDAVGFRSGILLGHSDGATIAGIHAGSVVDHRVRGLVLIAPHFFTEPAGLAAIAAAKDAYETGLREKMARYHAHPDHAFHGWNEAWLSPAFKDWNVADVIDYWRIPALVLQGSDDAYGTLAQVEEAATRSYAPVDVSIFEGCGHAPHLEVAEPFLEAVVEFAARLRRIENEYVEVQ